MVGGTLFSKAAKAKTEKEMEMWCASATAMKQQRGPRLCQATDVWPALSSANAKMAAVNSPAYETSDAASQDQLHG
jgi:hypothetical protein